VIQFDGALVVHLPISVVILALEARTAFGGVRIAAQSENSVMNIRLTACLFVLAFTSAVHAQWLASVNDPFAALLTPHEERRVAEMLGLEGIQHDVWRLVFDLYRAEHAEMLREWREVDAQRQQLVAVSSDSGFPERLTWEFIEQRRLQNEERGQRDREAAALLARLLDLAEQERRRKVRVESDIAAILEEEDQQEMWATFLRDLRRERFLNRGTSFSVERVDLVALCREAGILNEDESETASRVSQILEEYAAELDPLLHRRNELLYESERRHWEDQLARLEGRHVEPVLAEPPPGFSRDEAEAFQEAARAQLANARVRERRPLVDASRRIRNLNRLYLDRLVAEVDPADAEVLRSMFFRAAFPEYYLNIRGTNAARYLNQVRETIALTDEQLLMGIDAIADRFRSQFEEITLLLCRLKEREEDRWEDAVRGKPDRHIQRERERLVRLRRQIQEQAMSSVRALLSEEQQAKVAFNVDERLW
jgi:hypothetical protein